ncbi:MAG: carboxypeptidase M32, partial [Thermoleophilaceae bacterium]|nr:carboxypeptidase M32 [Thermoleophilaceae bacterium]
MEDTRLADLRRRLAEVADLEKAASLLSWDQQTMMPRAGAAARAEQLATLRRVAHERLASAELGLLLDALVDREQSLPPDSDEASLIRVARADHEKARRVPAELRAEMTRAGSLARNVWLEARARADFGLLLPHLELNVELCRRYADCFEHQGSPYDALLDIYEAGRTGAEVQAVFDRLKAELRPLIATVLEHGEAVEHDFLHGYFPPEGQRGAAMSLLELLGFDPASWRLDPTAHPFAMSGAPTDIRITTRFDSSHLTESLFMAMHEFGHGLYEHQVSPALWRSPLGRGASLGLHESQSRLWENLVGRSRGLWRMLLPRLRAAFPQQLAHVELEDFYRAVNRVELSPIRARADEATYNLHVILRFE